MFNPDADTMTGTVTVLTETEGEPVIQAFSIARLRLVQPSTSTRWSTRPYAAAVVEIEGGGGLVEQKATWPVGTNSIGESVSACANSPSDRWYFADR